MNYIFKLHDPYSEAIYIEYNHLIIIIGLNIMEAVFIVI